MSGNTFDQSAMPSGALRSADEHPDQSVPNWVVRKIDEHQGRLDGLDREVLKHRILIEQSQAQHKAVISRLDDIKLSQMEMNQRLMGVQSDRDKAAGVVGLFKFLGAGTVIAILSALIATQTGALNVQMPRQPEQKHERVLPGE